MAGYSFDDDQFYDDDKDEDQTPATLEVCFKCERKFNPDALARHEKICANQKKRKAFDSQKQRLDGFEKVAKTYSAPQKQVRKKDWRRQHQEFVKTIRAARTTTNAIKNGSELPPPPSPTVNPDYVQCPHCNRRFNEGAAERHIDFCKEQKSRLPKQMSDSKFEKNKAKQTKRTQYRPPIPGQKKTSIENSPVKPRRSSGLVYSPGSKPDGSPGTVRRNDSSADRNTKSNTSFGSRTKASSSPGRNDIEDRLLNNNSRYKTGARVSSGSSLSDNDSTHKPRSGKNRNGDPKWFEDMKRKDSGNQTRKTNQSKNTLDLLDSGTDMNENYTRNKFKRTPDQNDYPVGVVRPSSRSKENGFYGDTVERTVSAGRRQKMANFCHDCGTKYPVPAARFCCECGVKRMALT